MKKQTLKNYSKLVILIFGIVLLFTNCEQQVINEELKNQTNSYEAELTAIAKDWFNQSKNNLLILNYTKTIDWEHAIVSNGDNGDIIEIPLILNNDYSVKYNKDTSLTSFYRLIFVKDQTNQYELYTLIISTDDNSFDNNSNKFNYYNLQDNFNGFTVILNSKNELDAFNKYENGEKLTHPKNNSLFAKEPVFCTYFGYYICDTNNACVFEPLWLVGCSQGGGETAPNSGYHSTGGGNNYTTPDNWEWVEDNTQGRNVLCGSYSFSSVGSASVANISGLGMRIQSGYVSIDAEFSSPLCITISNTIPTHASAIFNSAWNVAMTEVYAFLNATYIISVPSQEQLKKHIIDFLNANLKLLQPGSIASTYPCSGSIPTTKASYCP